MKFCTYIISSSTAVMSYLSVHFGFQLYSWFNEAYGLVKHLIIIFHARTINNVRVQVSDWHCMAHFVWSKLNQLSESYYSVILENGVQKLRHCEKNGLIKQFAVYEDRAHTLVYRLLKKMDYRRTDKQDMTISWC